MRNDAKDPRTENRGHQVLEDQPALGGRDVECVRNAEETPSFADADQRARQPFAIASELAEVDWGERCADSLAGLAGATTLVNVYEGEGSGSDTDGEDLAQDRQHDARGETKRSINDRNEDRITPEMLGWLLVDYSGDTNWWSIKISGHGWLCLIRSVWIMERMAQVEEEGAEPAEGALTPDAVRMAGEPSSNEWVIEEMMKMMYECILTEAVFDELQAMGVFIAAGLGLNDNDGFDSVKKWNLWVIELMQRLPEGEGCKEMSPPLLPVELFYVLVLRWADNLQGRYNYARIVDRNLEPKDLSWFGLTNRVLLRAAMGERHADLCWADDHYQPIIQTARNKRRMVAGGGETSQSSGDAGGSAAASEVEGMNKEAAQGDAKQELAAWGWEGVW